MVKVDLSGTLSFLPAAGPDYAAAALAHRALQEGTWAGAEFTGWRSLPRRVQGEELKQILSAADKIRDTSEVLVVIGVGGSYLGAKAAVELLKPKNGIELLFVGNNFSADDLNDKMEILGERDFSINVISKSGKTLESALAFRIFRIALEKKYGAGAKKRIYATTDAHEGVLHDLAIAEGYECFVVPNDIGGRFSVLSAVGLLPMAVAGIDVRFLINAAAQCMYDLELLSPENSAWQYAAVRNALYSQGKTIEILASYEPSFRFFGEWWKQLFGESEGKNGVGIFPVYVEYSADLHSLGQYIQDGPRTMMETVVSFERNRKGFTIPFELKDQDKLNYLAGRELSDVAQTISRAVQNAHVNGGVPNISITASMRNEEGLAELICFFEMSCAISAYMLGVNPFDQPGVEAYKKNMFRLLGRPE